VTPWLSAFIVCIDCLDTSRLAAFWADALGWRITFAESDQVAIEAPFGSRDDGVVPDLLFVRVPDDRIAKNRLPLDLRPGDQFAEVKRLLGLGARQVDVGQSSDSTWVVLADLEGNVFCVLRPFTEEEMATLS
jgi:hypothetical protein